MSAHTVSSSLTAGDKCDHPEGCDGILHLAGESAANAQIVCSNDPDHCRPANETELQAVLQRSYLLSIPIQTWD
jgi:hypothetical protein